MHSRSIGMALSSGGAAGLAHIGVLEVLEEAGIDIACVAGTSAGAMVGAAFAANQLSGLHDRFAVVTRRQLMRLFDPSWAGGGLFAGRRAMDLMRPFIGEKIENLSRPFAAIATDILSGTPEVIRTGPVADAVRASIAIPGVFTPVLRDGRLFVDGALVDPVPVEATRALGATFVIAVSVIPPPYSMPVRSACEPPLDESWLNRYWRSLSAWLPADVAPEAVADGEEPPPASAPHTLSMILMRSSIVVQSHIAAARLRQHPPDVLIQPDVGTVGVFDFDRAAEAIDAGRRAAMEALPKLRRAIEHATVPPRRRTLRRLVLGRQAA